MSDKGKYTTVSIPTELADKAREHIKGTGFKNLSDYVTFILREIAASKRDWDGAKDKDDKDKVIEKLKALGYIR
jgi:Arc/MetJ-type ribon-helix-helix transcriptional regulator